MDVHLIMSFEIFSAGGTPYEDVYPLELGRFLNDGRRMEQPELCPSDMLKPGCAVLCSASCFMCNRRQLQTSERRSFEDIRGDLAECLEYLPKCYGNISLSLREQRV